MTISVTIDGVSATVDMAPFNTSVITDPRSYDEFVNAHVVPVVHMCLNKIKVIKERGSV